MSEYSKSATDLRKICYLNGDIFLMFLPRGKWVIMLLEPPSKIEEYLEKYTTGNLLQLQVCENMFDLVFFSEGLVITEIR